MRSILAIACASAFCGIAAAQGGGWAAVEGITPESTVQIRRLRAATVKGTFISASSSGVKLQTSDGSTRNIDRRRIARVYLLKKSQKLRDGLIGAGIGFASGFALGYMKTAKYESTPTGPAPNNRAGSGAIAGTFLAAVGAAIGVVVGRIKGPSRALIYERDSSRGRRARVHQDPKAAAEGAAR